MAQIPQYMLFFCMSAFTYYAFLKFHFLSWTPEFFHRPVISRNTVGASYSLGSGKPGAGSNADALASCFHLLGTEHGRENQRLLTSISIPGRVRGEPGLGSSQKNTKQNRLGRASLWGMLSKKTQKYFSNILPDLIKYLITNEIVFLNPFEK